MRVFHLVKGLGRGGAETLLVRTAGSEPLSARRNGYGFFLPWKDALVPALCDQGCVVKCFSAKNPAEMLLRLPELVLFLKNWHPDLIHGHLPLAGVMARLAGKVLGVPVVYTEHNLQERYHTLTRAANRLTWRMQARVVAVSAEVRESIAKSLPPETPVQIVLNGVDCERFSPQPDLRQEIRADLGLKEDDFLVGTVAVFRKQKRLDLWLEVARRLAEEFPNVHFVLVGDGPERGMVDRLVLEYGLESRIHLPGLLADVLPYYSALDSFFMSSDFEGLPVALLEAMASAVPAVVTDAGGIGEVIRDSTEGLMAPTGDVEGLAAHLKSLYLDREAANRVGRNGRARVSASFSLDRMSQELEELYRGVLGRRLGSQSPRGLEGYEFDRSVSADEAMSLIRLSLGEGSERSPRTLEFYRWKHELNPFGNSYLLGARTSDGGELAGLRLFQNWGLVRDEQRFKAVRAVDTSTHPEHRRRGIFTELTRTALQDLTSQQVALVFNTPNKNSLPGYLRMGWELVAQVPVKAKLLTGRGGRSEDIDDTFVGMLQQSDPASIDAFVVSCRVPSCLQVEKGLEYLRWRYTGHPRIQYRFAIRAPSGQPTALVVWCATSRYRLQELVLCELFAVSVEEAAILLGEVLSRSRCHYAVSAFLNNPVAESVVRSLGFRSLPHMGLKVTVRPLGDESRTFVRGDDWVLSTGDLQVF